MPTLISFHGGCHCGLGRVAAFFCCTNAVDDLVPPVATNAFEDGPSRSFPPDASAFCCMSMMPALFLPAWRLKYTS